MSALLIVLMLVAGGIATWRLGTDSRHPEYVLRQPVPSAPRPETLESWIP
jgi:hypothetical protein